MPAGWAPGEDGGASGFVGNLLGAADGVGHDDAGGELDLGAEVAQEGDPRGRDALRHREQEPVAAARGGEGQADAGAGMARHQLGCSRRQPETQAATT